MFQFLPADTGRFLTDHGLHPTGQLVPAEITRLTFHLGRTLIQFALDVGLLDVGLRVSVAEPLVGAVAAVVAAAVRAVRALARAALRVAGTTIRQAAPGMAILSAGAGACGAKPKPGPIPDAVCRLGFYPNPASGRLMPA
jgi:hypothetical protein